MMDGRRKSARKNIKQSPKHIKSFDKYPKSKKTKKKTTKRLTKQLQLDPKHISGLYAFRPFFNFLPLFNHIQQQQQQQRQQRRCAFGRLRASSRLSSERFSVRNRRIFIFSPQGNRNKQEEEEEEEEEGKEEEEEEEAEARASPCVFPLPSS